ncbi:methyltransferase, putative, family protein [Mycobacterium bohemicum DSM 44277]|uniref:S-adenosyl-L-methionine-dependent methyltransferase n=2 Tax=Mycobacterium bohemicum TaxID=56425 RepID=A0A1X1RD16_MYCBE|nr:class I SAM-dependent methyltransferase [Mycobacterium bohemicum]MCV6972518.1 SAM-dependent methyltransferase [Mycobacterium bohemicum]ORV03019.1 hypothetical protein AWB93_04315 [Mycobacterium bohemicum]CPR11630.1 methyltransferase, putative, family protein [Mycobacterium bohemicum DSM 44277]
MSSTVDTRWDAATFGAVARAVASGKGRMDDPFAEPLVRAAGEKRFVGLINDERFAADEGANPVTGGLVDIVAAHTTFVDGFLADAGRAGVRQVVILGAGLDARAYRLWWPRGSTVYELDRPEVLDFKAGVLRGLGATLTVSRCAIGVDLRRDWPAALLRSGFDRAAPTAWVAEQLLVGHLPADAQHRLLTGVTRLSAAGSRFAADHMPGLAPGHPDADSVPGQLRGQRWEVVERNVVDLLTVMGLRELWGGGSDDAALVPRYVTAAMR